MTYAQLIYMINDEVKLLSDDEVYTEDHIIFLINKYRAFVLKKVYADIKKQIPESNYQTICLELEETNAIDGDPCTGGTYLRSKEEIPVLLPIGSSQVYPTDYFQGDITYVPRERMRYIGFNRYMRNIIYASLGPDNHLYFKSNNPQHKYLEQVKFTGIFEDSAKASELSCKGSNESCDTFDKIVAIEEALVPTIIELIVRELLGVKYQPEDRVNDAAPLPNAVNSDARR